MSDSRDMEDMRQRFIEDPSMTDDEVRAFAAEAFAEDVERAADMAEWLVGLKRHQRERARRAAVFSRHGGEPTDEALRARAVDDLKENPLGVMPAFEIEPILADATEQGRVLYRVNVRTEHMGNGALEGEVLPLRGLGTFTTTSPYFTVVQVGDDLMKSNLMGCGLFAFKREDGGDVGTVLVNFTDPEGNAIDLAEFTDHEGNLYAYEVDGRLLTFGDLFKAFTYKRASLSLLAELEREEAEADAITIRYGAEMAQHTRVATRRKKPRTITCKNRDGETVMLINGVDNALTLNASSRKTFTLLNREATRMSMAGEYRHDGETVCRVALSVSEVARLYDITEESAKKRLRRDFKAIANESLTIEKRGKGGGWGTVPTLGDTFGIRGDMAVFPFSPSFMQMLLYPSAPRIDLPPELFATDDTNHPAAFQIGVKLYAHDNQNHGKANQDRLKLTTLTYAARELPTPEELAKGRRSKTERIMGPFEAAMDHLVDVGALKAWDYCHENGEQLTDEEYQAIETEHELGRPTTWELAEGLLVTWELGRRYPEHEAARMASREKRLEEKMAAKAKREKEAEASARRIRGKKETAIAKALAEEELGAHQEGEKVADNGEN